MKLFEKYKRLNIIATIGVLILGSICYYFIIRYVLIRQLDDTLKIEEEEILDFVKLKKNLPEPANYKDQLISFTLVEQPVRRIFRSIGLYIQSEKEIKPYRKLEFPVTVNGLHYEVSVSKSQVETEDLLGLIVLITMGVIVLLLLIQFILNRYFLRKIWTPFYDTLETIKQFNLTNRKPIPVHRHDIEEFASLDGAVEQMISKIISDYETLKNFADNASHEMQTPLAVINSKLDLMIQEKNLNEKQVSHLQAMYDAVGRMSKLNQSLLLLSKIENDQFAYLEPLLMHNLINNKLAQLEEMSGTKNLTINRDIQETSLQMNQYLADILLNNLLTNAIRHNTNNGEITILLNPDLLKISNSGPPLSFDPVTIFERFKKSSYSDGTGLGLAIVKQICDKYQYTVTYTYRGQIHSFSIRF